MLLFITWMCAFVFFTCIGYLVIFRINKTNLIMYKRVKPYLSSRIEINNPKEEDIKNKSLYVRLILPIFLKVRHKVEQRMPKRKLDQIEKKLQAAGHPLGISAGDFVLIQILLPIPIFILTILLLIPTEDERFRIIFLAVIISLLAYIYPNFYLSKKMKEQTKVIDKAMPDFFDMLNVSIEAGMGLDGALKKVCSQMDTPLSREFLSALEDMKLGKSRKEAFIELRERVHSEFFKSVITSIIQADKMGIGMSRVLRTQTVRIREKQRFDAKEQAMKAPVKMLIPMVLFIFPTLFIVLIGPVIVNLVIQFM